MTRKQHGIVYGVRSELRANNSSLCISIDEDFYTKFKIFICDRRTKTIISEVVINPHIVELIQNLRAKEAKKKHD